MLKMILFNFISLLLCSLRKENSSDVHFLESDELSNIRVDSSKVKQETLKETKIDLESNPSNELNKAKRNPMCSKISFDLDEMEKGKSECCKKNFSYDNKSELSFKNSTETSVRDLSDKLRDCELGHSPIYDTKVDVNTHEGYVRFNKRESLSYTKNVRNFVSRKQSNKIIPARRKLEFN